MMECEPSYYKKFRCIAGECSDTCCAGWEIVLDEEAFARYRKVQGSFGEKLKKEIRQEGEEAYFALTEENRCPFLNKENLCEIYRHLGEDALCDICREHPRFYNWIGAYTEKGLGLCCEEAQRLLFEEKEPLTFVFTREGEEEEMAEDLQVLLQMRGEAFAILQDRKAALPDRIKDFVAYMSQVQRALDGEDAAETDTPASVALTPDYACTLLEFFLELDCLDDRWKALLLEAKGRVQDILAEGLSLLAEQEKRLYEWEHVAVYLLYRYFTEAIYDGDVMTRGRLVTVCLTLLALLAGYTALTEGYTEEKRDILLRLFSREIEYCPENMEALYEAIREGRI